MSQIHQLIENSKVNESIARKLFEIETEVLACQSSEGLLQRLLGLIQTKFQFRIMKFRKRICYKVIKPHFRYVLYAVFHQELFFLHVC